mgnify:CR=1 FL=1
MNPYQSVSNERRILRDSELQRVRSLNIKVNKYSVDKVIDCETACRDVGNNKELFYMMLEKMETMSLINTLKDLKPAFDNKQY